VSDITRILSRVEQGEAKAAEELVPLVYEELRKIAAARMAEQGPGQTLQPTALVHEAYLRLSGAESKGWHDRRHFLAAAAAAMRHILIDAARKKACHKRGGGWHRLDLEAVHLAADSQPEDLLAVDEALDEFTREFPQKAALVHLRFFVGLSLPEAAETLSVSLATAKRSWAFSRAWLYDRLTGAR
jgi:RNA polymerase sigma factor (TIGR02999 family)